MHEQSENELPLVRDVETAISSCDSRSAHAVEGQKIKSDLSAHLVALERIWDDFIRNSELTITELRLDRWKQEARETLACIGKAEKFLALSRMIEEIGTDPVQRFFDQAKKYRAFLSALLKELESDPKEGPRKSDSRSTL